ncbi:unnamed protein product [Rhizoctonia solani]|uniref:Fungal-type protein kinase domain-containing protein n=1 Tax=Rhizoctonia solani TaxID=456999 RepID=A0A8H3BPU6_9AGAM|nr:unnamed protein product [Rhizoctonia solani]
MPSSSEASRRRARDDTVDAPLRISKRIKTSAFASPSATSSLSATNSTKALPAMILGSTTFLGKSTSSDLPVDDGSSQIDGSSAAPPSTPRRAERPMVKFPNTPIKPSTSNMDPSCISPSQSSSYRSGGGPKARESQQTQQATRSNEITKVSLVGIKDILKHELCGSVYLHKGFFKEFLVVKPDIQTRVLQRARSQAMDPARSLGHANYVDYDDVHAQWTLDAAITSQRDEKRVYEPLARALNVIGKATFDIYRGIYPSDTIRRSYFPFVDHSSRETRNDSPSDGAVMPDLLQGWAEEGRVHWGDTDLIIECKSKDTVKLHSEAYMQLARYARSVFSHQIYRVGVFGFSLCGSIVNFVRFDRSGMLHSPDIDLSKPEGAHMFIQHVITLLTLDAGSFGYDTRYSFDFSASPPQTLFKFGNQSPELVHEILCHRKCICGRATCVTGLGQLVLKVIWRPADRADEGETMKRFKHVFGFCQLKDASCDTYNTKLKYANELEQSTAAKAFTPDSYSPGSTTISRGIRIESSILMRRGMSLFEVQNPLHLVMAIHDALLGIMGLTEVGKIHCDVSAYNLLLIDPKKHYPDQNWLGQSTFQIRPEVWKETARSSFEAGGSYDAESEYESPRLKRVKALGRGPYCVLHDTEFTVDARPNRKDVHPDRTGTPAFISAQLLIADSPNARTFMHDIESLFWVLVWVLIRRGKNLDGPWSVNEHAKQLIRDLSNNDFAALGKFKRSFIKSSVDTDCEQEILKLENPWCEDLVLLIQEFGAFLYCYLYAKTTRAFSEWAGDAFQQGLPQLHDQFLDQPHLQTFEVLFTILERHMGILEKKYQVDLTKL